MKKLKHVPAPWTWDVNESTHSIRLMGFKNGSRHTVMDFRRYGMQSAQPRFEDDGILYPSTKLFKVIKEQEHNSSWNKTLENPNARIISSAPEMLEALIFLYGIVKENGSSMPQISSIIEKATGMSIEEVLQCQK
jgi:hypothetical protein